MTFTYTAKEHHAPYPSISPSLPALSTASKTVFIAGGSAGIGRAAALAFLAAGCRRIALTGRRSDVLSSTAADLASRYPDAQCLTFAIDILDVEGMDGALAAVRESLGAADIVINCASALSPVGPVAATPLAAWWAGFEVNVRGAVVLAQAVAKHASPEATLLQLSTAGALFPADGAVPISGYAASKLAVIKVMEYLGAENPRLRVICVHPGVVVDTELGRRMVHETGLLWEGDDSESGVFISTSVTCHGVLCEPAGN
jgi:NAD(P)-dependent dehydrogenase (short-subunit alcohol dehydrogenase family)